MNKKNLLYAGIGLIIIFVAYAYIEQQKNIGQGIIQHKVICDVDVGYSAYTSMLVFDKGDSKCYDSGVCNPLGSASFGGWVDRLFYDKGKIVMKAGETTLDSKDYSLFFISNDKKYLLQGCTEKKNIDLFMYDEDGKQVDMITMPVVPSG